MNAGIVEECDYEWPHRARLTRRAIKASSREFAQLRYILAHLGQQQGRLCVPSNILVDMCGFRFLIVSALPVRGDTYVYNETTPSAQLTHRMPCLNSTAEYEVWKGDDHRDYLLSCKKLLVDDPMVLSAADFPRNVRPEVVDDNFGKDAAELRAELQRVIGDVCAELEAMEYPPTNSPELSAFLHARGVSIRHIGLLYNLTSKQWLKDLLYVEMFARAGKCILWKNLRCLIYNDKLEFDANVHTYGANVAEGLNTNYRESARRR